MHVLCYELHMLFYVSLGAGHIIIDVCAYDDGSIIENPLTLDSINQNLNPEGFIPNLRRYVLPLGSGTKVCCI